MHPKLCTPGLTPLLSIVTMLGTMLDVLPPDPELRVRLKERLISRGQITSHRAFGLYGE